MHVYDRDRRLCQWILAGCRDLRPNASHVHRHRDAHTRWAVGLGDEVMEADAQTRGDGGGLSAVDRRLCGDLIDLGGHDEVAFAEAIHGVCPERDADLSPS